jgi:hypothetical protein
MIALKSPITIERPNINGKKRSPITFNSIDYSVGYDNSKKVAYIKIDGFPLPVVIWSGADYDKAGQFTDADVDARVAKLVGKDPEKFLSSLVK